MDIQIIDNTQYNGWDSLILSSVNYSFFHSAAWSQVLKESYNYTPLYFSVINDGQLIASIPMMEINSFLTGKRAVSLPYTDYCDPILDDGIKLQDLMNFIIEYGKKGGWKYLEFRVEKDLFPFFLPSCTYLGHSMDLSDKEDQIFSSFRDSTKRNIKKATKQGVRVTKSNSLEHIKEFYRLNCMTRKQHGLPPQPFSFFERIYDYIISKNLGLVVLAFYEQKAVASAVYFHFGNKVVYKYGASDMRYQDFRANNLVMWEAIKWYSQNGYKSLCFGRTEPENNGLLQFKSGRGTTEQQICYYRYNFTKGSFVSGSPKVRGFYNKIFRNMPIPILKKVGSILYKHAG